MFQGFRHLEIDCWDRHIWRDGEGAFRFNRVLEPVVTHVCRSHLEPPLSESHVCPIRRVPLLAKQGHTFCTVILFDEVAAAIGECAFGISELPVILSLEVTPPARAFPWNQNQTLTQPRA